MGVAPQSIGVESVEVVAAEFIVGHVFGEHVVGGDEDCAGDGEDRQLLAAAAGDLAELGGQVCILGAGTAPVSPNIHRVLDTPPLRPWTPRQGPPTVAWPRISLSARISLFLVDQRQKVHDDVTGFRSMRCGTAPQGP